MERIEGGIRIERIILDGEAVIIVGITNLCCSLAHKHAKQQQKYAVILGNEVKGVHQEVVDASDGCLEIPQLGTKHSMNVSVTAGIIIYKFAENLFLNQQ
jgi:tRNA G18 (ribose-2'-O)-methylase SpoU